MQTERRVWQAGRRSRGVRFVFGMALWVACARPPVTEEPAADEPRAEFPVASAEATSGVDEPGVPQPRASAVGELGDACLAAEECASGVCEGEGCDTEHPGHCVPATRPCTRDLALFCGCDGQVFRGSGSCPGRRYARRGSCDSTR